MSDVNGRAVFTWQNGTDLGKCTHIYNKTMKHKCFQQKIVFFRCKNIHGNNKRRWKQRRRRTRRSWFTHPSFTWQVKWESVGHGYILDRELWNLVKAKEPQQPASFVTQHCWCHMGLKSHNHTNKLHEDDNNSYIALYPVKQIQARGAVRCPASSQLNTQTPQCSFTNTVPNWSPPSKRSRTIQIKPRWS